MKTYSTTQITLKRLLLFFMPLFILFMGKVNAQSTMGTDFWVTFLPNSDDENVTLSLIAAGARPCTGTVTNPHTSYSQSFSVTPGVTTTVPITKAEAYNYTGSDCTQNTALHVVTTDTISLYASNFEEYTFDVTDVLPSQSLGSDYIIQTYPATFKGGKSQAIVNAKELEHDYSTFVILAIEDNTQVNINLSNNSLNGHYANTPFNVTLNAGECYQVKAAPYGDFSGTHISVADNKIIAVFAGNQCAYIPAGYGYADHIVEQMIPTTCWGQHFVITNSMLRSNDIIRVTALNDNCQIMKNGSLITTINARQTYQFEITSDNPSAYLETSEPAMVFLYLTGSEYAGENGDPSMVLVSPIEQGIGYVTFSTFNSGVSQYHYVNIVTNTNQVSGMRLDANSISSQFQPVSGNSDYSFARVDVNHGSHTLYNQNGVFVAHVYGLGDDESYGYSVGSMAINLTSQMTVNGQSITQHPNGFFACIDDEISFELNLNYTFSQANWTFGDGGTGSGSPVTHSYSTPGDYPVSCDIYAIEEEEEILVSTLTTMIHVGTASQSSFYETQCNSYQWNDVTYTETGDYEQTFQNIYGCDSIVTLHLTVNYNSDTTYLSATSCDYYYWYDQIYTQSGQYETAIPNSYGCDSILVLNLTINHSDTTYFSATSCDYYYWYGRTYIQSGQYEISIPNSYGCDSILVLNLTVNHSDTTYLSVTSCDYYYWYGRTYIQSGQYKTTIPSSYGCDSTLILNLTVNHSDTTYLSATSCDFYNWYGRIYTQSGQYETTITNSYGCDSLLVLNLTVGYDAASDTMAVACDSYEWNGTTYTETGDYDYQTQTVLGCDSIVTLHLTVNLSDTTLLDVAACDNYEWNGDTLTKTGVYEYIGQTVEGCDSIVILDLAIHSSPTIVIHGKSYVFPSTDMTSGQYSYFVDSTDFDPSNVHWDIDREDWLLVPHGASCDLICTSEGQAVIRAWTEGEPCDVDTTMVLNATFFGIGEEGMQPVTVYPNPTNGSVTIEGQDIVAIKVYNIMGQMIREDSFDRQDRVVLDLSGHIDAVYVLEITIPCGKIYRRVMVTR